VQGFGLPEFDLGLTRGRVGLEFIALGLTPDLGGEWGTRDPPASHRPTPPQGLLTDPAPGWKVGGIIPVMASRGSLRDGSPRRITAPWGSPVR